MDPRQPPQHPFSRNTASPYGRTPFPPSSNQAPFPPSSHPPPAAPSYPEHQRRPSDPPYYNPQRSYGQEGQPMQGGGHSRHQSASSIGHGTPVNRNMPPPSSPQQAGPQQAPHHGYGPPPPRAPPVSVGPISGFSSGRELPSLPSLGRPPSTGSSSMSISSMLGGPPPASREPPPSQYPPPATTAPQSSMFSASPRMGTAGSDYAPFRRPHTPEHQRGYEPRDHKANSAGSPPGVGQYSTPEGRRYGTPQQGYGQRVPIPEERREPARVPNPNGPPPRPNSQPNAFNPPPPRVAENPRPVQNDSIFGRRVESVSRAPEPIGRQEPPYGRPQFEERSYGYAERERREREANMQREQERERELRELREREVAIQRERDRERERIEHENIQREREYAHQMAQRNAQTAYNRPPEPRDQRDQPPWMRANYEIPRPAYEPIPEHQPRPAPPPASNGYEQYPTSAPSQYGVQPSYPPSEPRHTQSQPPSSMPPQHNPPPQSQYEASLMEQQERQRAAMQQQFQQQQQIIGGPPQNGPKGTFQAQESPQRRPIEDLQHSQQRSFLGVQEINRKGRASPLPQAVQGAQGQMNGPGGEPSIKNEFGRMFSGIGSGVGVMGVPSPVAAGPQSMPFSNSAQLRDLEALQDSPSESGGQRIARSASRGGRRRKLKEEETRGDDESSTGRRTPSGSSRVKRAKTHHHHHHHHHHHRPDPVENVSSPSLSNLTPFKSVKGSAIPSPPGPDKAVATTHHHHVQRPHQPHHHHHVPAAKPPAPIVIAPLRKTKVINKAVLDSVSNLPRHHLGHMYYKSTLTPEGLAGLKRNPHSRLGYASTPEPLPDFTGNENCTFTVRVPRAYLDDICREEITSRKSLWGTDVYTDDSDVIAACIHQGWIRGAWPENIDVSLIGLEIPVETNGAVQKPLDINGLITEPPATGPMAIPPHRDLHVTVLILPTLQKYASTTRFGIKSREWGFKHDGFKSIHDGVSFMILAIKWVTGVDGEAGRKGTERRKIFHQQLEEQEIEQEQMWADLLINGNGARAPRAQFQESFLRGSNPQTSSFKGIGTKSWWKASSATKEVNGKGKDPEPAVEEVELAATVEEPEDAEESIQNGLKAEEVPGEVVSEPTAVAEETQPLVVGESIESVPPMAAQPDITSPAKAGEDASGEQQRQILRVTERMIENANMAAPPLPPAPVIPATPRRTPLPPPPVEPISPVGVVEERPQPAPVEIKREKTNDENASANDTTAN